MVRSGYSRPPASVQPADKMIARIPSARWLESRRGGRLGRVDIVEQQVLRRRILLLHRRRIDRRILFLAEYHPRIAQVVRK